MGCSLASSLVDLIKEIKRKRKPEFLFIEPSEMVVTQEIRDVAAMGLRDMTYNIGPLITLIDGPMFGFLWEERKSLLLGQMQNADLTAVSRADILDAENVKEIHDTLKAHCHGLINLSAIRNTGQNTGVEEVIKTIENFS